MAHDWDENDIPLAYLLTFRTYGTWHHGDERGSVDRQKFNRFGSPKMLVSMKLVAKEASTQKSATFIFDERQQAVVDTAIREVCRNRSYRLLALNVRSNHAHAVVSSAVKPEKIIEAFKSYATRRLRENYLVEGSDKIWSRHGSTRYLWKDPHVVAAIDYVLYSQGDEFPNFDELVG